MSVFSSVVEWLFLQGFLRKGDASCGVFVVTLWCFVWWKMVRRRSVFDAEKYAN
jgi:hypothetical protein